MLLIAYNTMLPTPKLAPFIQNFEFNMKLFASLWECIPLLPFIDERALDYAVATLSLSEFKQQVKKLREPIRFRKDAQKADKTERNTTTKTCVCVVPLLKLSQASISSIAATSITGSGTMSDGSASRCTNMGTSANLSSTLRS